ncbi:hypothetical protein DCAR_0625787 [Daucus carota subsp. sativus]|uniref:Uncharacterized protein n=1 Tax=Daucus carota subsp. sativus TaxID=79200 RepID=A0A164WP94_DAUCS|nr:hypothetical protein DCAR_0625787 [Daucus carota subsp. sativus]
MDKPLAIQEKKTSKPRHRQNPQKSKKKQQDPQATNAPVKVVYIDNPVNFSTSASEFRSLVQQLTGKHSCSPDNSVGGREQLQESAVDSAHASLEVQHPHQNLGVAEAEEIASSSSLNCPATTSDHNTNSVDLGHRAVHDDDFYNMPDQMLDDYLPPDFWYDRY